MEILNNKLDNQNECGISQSVSKKIGNDILEITSNWQVNNGKNLTDTLSIIPPEATDRTNLEDIVSLDTCIELYNPGESKHNSPLIDIRITNSQEISGMTVISEASVLEVFKQCGEYTGTVFADFYDEFENKSVYIGVVKYEFPTHEASIKLIKRNNKKSSMWLYGIGLTLTELLSGEDESKMFHPQIINDLLLSLNKPKSRSFEIANKVFQSFNRQNLNAFNGSSMDTRLAEIIGMRLMTGRQKFSKNEEEESESKQKSSEQSAATLSIHRDVKCSSGYVQSDTSDIRIYINRRLEEIESKLMERMDQMEQKTNQKLDMIMKMLEFSKH